MLCFVARKSSSIMVNGIKSCIKEYTSSSSPQHAQWSSLFVTANYKSSFQVFQMLYFCRPELFWEIDANPFSIHCTLVSVWKFWKLILPSTYPWLVLDYPNTTLITYPFCQPYFPRIIFELCPQSSPACCICAMHSGLGSRKITGPGSVLPYSALDNYDTAFI